MFVWDIYNHITHIKHGLINFKSHHSWSLKGDFSVLEGMDNLRITLDSDLHFFLLENKKSELIKNDVDYPKILEFKFLYS